MEADGLTRTGRAARLAVTALVGALMLLGTLVGQDDAFPFGPLRMYATSSKPSGVVSVVRLEVRVAGDPSGAWRPTSLTPGNIGVNRAEVEGRAGRIVEDPALLGALADAHARLHPEDAPWVAVRLVRVRPVLVDRRPTGEEQVSVAAQWERPV